MSVSDELVWLINQIRNTQSARERLRLLALGWRTLRNLNPTDRLLLAKELGIDGGEHLVEELSRRGGVSPSLLLGALRAAEAAPPERIRDLVRGLLDPDRRTETVETIAEGAADWMIGEATDEGSAELESESEPAPDPHDARQSTLEAALDAAALDAVEAAQELRDEELEIELPPEPEPAEEAEAPPEIEPAPEPGPEPEEADVSEEPEPVAVELHRVEPPVEEPAQLPEEPPVPVSKQAVVVEEEPDAEPPAVAPTFERKEFPTRITDARTVLERLREVDRSAGELAGLDLDHLELLLEGFAPGWARRRTLETLIRAGVPERLEDLLTLIRGLESPADRMWALTAVAARLEIDSDDAARLLEEADTPVLARRLALRMRQMA
jgi:hypothetical protein